MFNRFFGSFLYRAVVESANKIAEDARSNASWSSDIPGAIKVGEVNENNGMYEIIITVDLTEEGAPMARAFEFGSGLKTTRGEAKKYMIAPVNAERLAFPISRWLSYEPPPNVEVAVFPGAISAKPYIMHPGVAPKPFLQPAIDKNRKSIRGIILNAVKRGALATIKVRFLEAEKE